MFCTCPSMGHAEYDQIGIMVKCLTLSVPTAKPKCSDATPICKSMFPSPVDSATANTGSLSDCFLPSAVRDDAQ